MLLSNTRTLSSLLPVGNVGFVEHVVLLALTVYKSLLEDIPPLIPPLPPKRGFETEFIGFTDSFKCFTAS